MLLKELLKKTAAEHTEHEAIERSFHQIAKMNQEINETQRRAECAKSVVGSIDCLGSVVSDKGSWFKENDQLFKDGLFFFFCCLFIVKEKK